MKELIDKIDDAIKQSSKLVKDINKLCNEVEETTRKLESEYLFMRQICSLNSIQLRASQIRLEGGRG